MSSKEIPNLPAAGPLTGAELFHLIQGGNSRYATVALLLEMVVDAAPGSLDTLNELAAALGDDANFAATVTAALGAKAAAADLAALTAVVAVKAPDLLVPDIVAGAAYATVVGDRYSAKRLTAAALVTVTLTDDPPVGSRIRFGCEGAGGATFAVEGGAGLTMKSRGGNVNSSGVYAVVEAWRDSAASWTLLGDVG